MTALSASRKVGRRSAAFTLVEVMIAIAIVGIMTAIGVPQFTGWVDAQRVKGAARQQADAFALARTEAIRTGNNHIVWTAIGAITGVDGGSGIPVDAGGNEIVDNSGNPVAILVHDDGAPATANCQIDGGEARQGFQTELNVNYGSTAAATFKVGTDTTGVAAGTEATFASPDNPAGPVAWVLFRGGDGIPVTFAGGALTCGNVGSIGSGRGGVYFNDGARDYATILSPVGGVRVHAWDPGANSWTN